MSLSVNIDVTSFEANAEPKAVENKLVENSGEQLCHQQADVEERKNGNNQLGISEAIAAKNRQSASGSGKCSYEEICRSY